jgi:hypothetical protein
MDVFLKGERGWTPAPSLAFARETDFQEIVQETFGQILMGEDEVPAVTAREVVTPEGGRIDVLSVDANGLISVCECKRERNAGSRREVLGQVLEYGGSLHGMSVDEFLTRVSDALRRRDPTSGGAEDELQAQMDGDLDIAAWRKEVADALERGHFRLVVAVDALTDVLRQTVVFLNERTQFPLVVAELRRLDVSDREVLLPRLFGEEAVVRKLPQKKTTSSVRDPDTVIVAAKRALPEFDELGAYICQPERGFRDVHYMGFYSHRTIDPRFPAIVDVRKNVPFTRAEVDRLRERGGVDAEVAAVLEQAMDAGTREEGKEYQIILLDLERGFHLREAITHPVEVGRSAWVQGQRYSRRDALEGTPPPSTTADLAEAGG